MGVVFPVWLPYWAQLSIGGCIGVLLCAVLLMPFAVFGLKSRLAYIETQLEDVQTALRVVVSRLPSRSPEDKYGSGNKNFAPSHAVSSAPEEIQGERERRVAQKASERRQYDESQIFTPEPPQIYREKTFTPQAENGLTASVLGSTDAYQLRSQYRGNEAKALNQEQEQKRQDTVKPAGWAERSSMESRPTPGHKPYHDPAQNYPAYFSEPTVSGKMQQERPLGWREQEASRGEAVPHAGQHSAVTPGHSPERPYTPEKKTSYFSWRSKAKHSVNKSELTERKEPHFLAHPSEGKAEEGSMGSAIQKDTPSFNGYTSEIPKNDSPGVEQRISASERKEPGLQWPPSV